MHSLIAVCCFCKHYFFRCWWGGGEGMFVLFLFSKQGDCWMVLFAWKSSLQVWQCLRQDSDEQISPMLPPRSCENLNFFFRGKSTLLESCYPVSDFVVVFNIAERVYNFSRAIDVIFHSWGQWKYHRNQCHVQRLEWASICWSSKTITKICTEKFSFTFHKFCFTFLFSESISLSHCSFTLFRVRLFLKRCVTNETPKWAIEPHWIPVCNST